MTTAQKQDVLDLLLEQHKQIKGLFNRVASGQGAEKRELFEDLVRLLAVHVTAEEEVVHPLARRRIQGGDQMVDTRLREEDETRRGLMELYELGVDHPDFNARLAAVADVNGRHADREEVEEFPQLRQSISTEQLRRMAGAVKVAEAISPTRPHATGESATANLLVGPPLAIFDRMRDAVRDWRESSKGG